MTEAQVPLLAQRRPLFPLYNERFVAEWVCAAGLVVVGFAVRWWSPVHDRPFDKHDPTLALPYTPQTLSLAHVVVYAWFVAMGVALLYHAGLQVLWNVYGDEEGAFVQYAPLQDDQAVTSPLDMDALALDTTWYMGKGRYAFADVHHVTLATMAATGLCLTIAETVKSLMGTLRPDFLQRCQWSDVLDRCMEQVEMRQGRRSFPSSQAAVLMTTATLCALYINSKLLVWTSRTTYFPRLPALVASLLPLMVGVGMSLCVYHKYENHLMDVVWGGVLGVVVAWRLYGFYFGRSEAVLTRSEACQARRVKGYRE
jgi:membrane-associated phospholipid phosphatase